MKYKVEQRIDSILVLEREYRHKYNQFFENIRALKESSKNQEFKITIIGEFSAGKSTFINALIGKSLLPSATNETTSTVTYIHNVGKEHPYYDQAVIEFNKGIKQEVVINLKEDGLKNYVTTFSSKYHVAKEIRAVHIYTEFQHTKEKIVLVDTPGLNGMAEGHKELTIKEIKDAHASIFLFHLRNLTSSNQELIRYASKHQPKILFVLNFIDELRHSEGETVEGKLAELKMQIQKYLPEVIKDKEVECFGISALHALAGRDERIKKLSSTDLEDLTFEKRKELIHTSRIELFEEVLWQDLMNGQRETIFYQALEGKIGALIEDMIHEVELSEKLRNAMIDKSAVKQIENRLKALKIQSTKQWEMVSDFILSQEYELIRLIQPKLHTDLQEVQKTFEKYVGKLENEAFEMALKNQSFNNHIKSQVMTVEKKYAGILEELLQEVYQSRIKYTQVFKPKMDIHVKREFRFPHSTNQVDLIGNEEEVSRLQKLVEQMEIESKQLKAKIDADKREITKIQMEVNSQKIEIEGNQEEFEKKRKELGSRPSTEMRTVTKTRSIEKRGFFGGIRYETETYNVQEVDDSKQRRWDASYQELNKESKRIQSLEKENRKLNQQLSELETEHHMDLERYKNYENWVKKNKQEIINKRKAGETQKRDAKREYLRKEKNRVYQISSELINQYETQLEQHIKKAITTHLNQIQMLVKRHYEHMQKQDEEKLKQLLDEKVTTQAYRELQNFKQVLIKIKEGTVKKENDHLKDIVGRTHPNKRPRRRQNPRKNKVNRGYDNVSTTT